jgi:hypothetical protein
MKQTSISAWPAEPIRSVHRPPIRSASAPHSRRLITAAASSTASISAARALGWPRSVAYAMM